MPKPPSARPRAATNRIADSGGRSGAHLLAGLALTLGAVAASALIAARKAPSTDNPQVRRAFGRFKPPTAAVSLIWPPLFLALTLSGLRVWNGRWERPWPMAGGRGGWMGRPPSWRRHMGARSASPTSSPRNSGAETGRPTIH